MGEFLEGAAEAAPEGPVSDGGATAAAVGLALARATGRKSKPDAVADRFLARQEELVAKQLHHLDEQFRHLRLRHFSERLKVMLQLLIIAVGVLILAAVGWMAWSAAKDDGLVIEALAVPLDLAQQGSSGAALANALQDKVVRLQQGTRTQFATSQVREKAAEGLKVEIPETGVSLAELNQALREWLGHETHITGELSRVLSGPERGALVLNVRVGAEAGDRLVAGDGDLDALLDQAALRVFSRVQPLSYAQWLGQHGRKAEELELLQQLSRRGSPAARAEAMMLAADNDTSITQEARARRLQQSVELTRTAIGLNDWAVAEDYLGHPEHALAILRRAGQADLTGIQLNAQGEQVRTELLQLNTARLFGDYAPSLHIACNDLGVAPCDAPRLADAVEAMGAGIAGTREAPRLGLAAVTMARMHDPRDADRLTAAPRPDRGNAEDNAIAAATWLGAALYIDYARQDWAKLLRDTAAREAAGADLPIERYPTAGYMFAPIALAQLGDIAAARARAAATPRDCYQCVIVRARVEALGGDWPAAERWFDAALRQGPSLPMAETEWARAMLARGRSGDAAAKAAAAARKGPRYADALEVWGEALLSKGDAAGAAAKLADAARLTPQWGRLHLKWGEALARQGKAAEARAQFALAAGLDLTPAERAELAVQKR